MTMFVSLLLKTLPQAILCFGNFGRSNHTNRIVAKSASTTGCKTCTPREFAMAPTANGKTVAPEAPTAAAKPTAATCSRFGRSLVNATTAAGNIGAMTVND